MPVQASSSELVELAFLVTDVDGITPAAGVPDASFGKVLLNGNVASALPVTVTETTVGGRYIAGFTPDAAGLWYVEVLTPFDDFFACYVEVDSECAVKLCEIHKILGLDATAPLSVSKTEQVAGDIKLTQTEVGNKIVVQREP